MLDKRTFNINYWSNNARLAREQGDTVTEKLSLEQVDIWTNRPLRGFSPFGGALGSGVGTGSLQE